MYFRRQFDILIHLFFIILLLISLILYGYSEDWLLELNLLQLLIGFYQLISSIIRTSRYKSLDKMNRKLLLIYWTLCLIYFSGLWIIFYYSSEKNDFFEIYFNSAWLIAFYYIYCTYQLCKKDYLEIISKRNANNRLL